MDGSLSLVGTLTARRGIQVADRFYVRQAAHLSWKIRNTLRWSYIKGEIAWRVGRPLARALGLMTVIGELRAIRYGRDGTATDFGVLGRRVVTTGFCQLMVDQLITETSVWGDFKYHDSGEGTTNEAVGDSAMEVTDGESRVVGTQVESTSVIYQSVGTISYTTTKIITEHGLFNDATGTTLNLMDRTEFSAINVVNGDSIQFTYSLTVTAGG